MFGLERVHDCMPAFRYPICLTIYYHILELVEKDIVGRLCRDYIVMSISFGVVL